MNFKEYLNESLIVEAKVKVAGREFPSKKDAGLFLAGQGKAVDQIERMTGLSAAGAKWCIAQSKKGDNKPKAKEPLKTVTIKKKETKEPVKNKAQERSEALEAYKKGEKYKPEPIELAKLDKEKSKAKAKDWLKKHGDDRNKEKELKAIQKEMDKLANEYDRLENKEQRLRNKGDISLIGAVEKRMNEIKKAMVRLNDKEAELK